MTNEMLEAMTPDDIVPLEVGPGCYRRALPGPDGARVWIVDMEPGSQWPCEDIHGDQGEQVWIVSGDLIEGEKSLEPEPTSVSVQTAVTSQERRPARGYSGSISATRNKILAYLLTKETKSRLLGANRATVGPPRC